MNHEVFRRTLVDRAGGTADARAIAEAATSVWHDAATRLAPVIGGHGVNVLFRRSLHITSKAFPWLGATGSEESDAELLNALQRHLAEREAALAIEVGGAILVTFTELLTSLIGESLTERLLRPIWATQALESEQEQAS